MKQLIAILLLIITYASLTSAQVVRLYQKVGNRSVVLTVKQETAEHLWQNQLTDADREDLQQAMDWALGTGETRRAVCISHDTPFDISRWERCPAQSIRRN